MADNNFKLLNMLGLAQKAHKIAVGDFAVETAIKNKTAELLVCAADTSERTAEKYRQLTKKHNIPLLIAGDKETLAYAVGKDGQTAVIALTDAGFARAIKNLCNKD